MSKKYKHINKGNGTITIFNSYGKAYTLRPNGKVTIDTYCAGNGVEVEEVKQRRTVTKKIIVEEKEEETKEEDE